MAQAKGRTPTGLLSNIDNGRNRSDASQVALGSHALPLGKTLFINHSSAQMAASVLIFPRPVSSHLHVSTLVISSRTAVSVIMASVESGSQKFDCSNLALNSAKLLCLGCKPHPMPMGPAWCKGVRNHEMLRTCSSSLITKFFSAAAARRAEQKATDFSTVDFAIRRASMSRAST